MLEGVQSFRVRVFFPLLIVPLCICVSVVFALGMLCVRWIGIQVRISFARAIFFLCWYGVCTSLLLFFVVYVVMSVCCYRYSYHFFSSFCYRILLSFVFFGFWLSMPSLPCDATVFLLSNFIFCCCFIFLLYAAFFCHCFFFCYRLDDTFLLLVVLFRCLPCFFFQLL